MPTRWPGRSIETMDAGDRLGDMGLRSRDIVEREFAWTVIVKRQIAVYEELLASKRRG